ncbi:MAG: FAD/NAD(P)-binding protein [Propionibacteriaceae bacterium]
MTSPSTTRTPSLVVVGLGPRGVISIERLGALLPGSGVESCELHLVEEHEPGAGKVWATDQHRELCMNTLAGAVTLFTDESYTGPGPIIEGPTLYEWCLAVREHVAGASWSLGTPLRDEVVKGGYEDELAAMRPESHPSRALYGEYLVWCYERAVSQLPASVSVRLHATRATAIDEAEGRTVVSLASGEQLEADAVVLATGWLDVGPGRADAALADAVAGTDLTWVRPDSPILQDLSEVPAGEPVIVRGLGMGFFDTMALLTIGRGGRFVPSDEPGGLTYEPSGQEPVLHVGSRRGVPFRAKSLYGGLPPGAPLEHLRSRDWSTAPRPIDYAREVWPLIVQDAYAAYYRTLHEELPGAFTAGLEPVIRAIDTASPGTIDTAVAPHVDAAHGLDLALLADPARGSYDSPASFDAYVARLVAEDLSEAELGTRSALKAGLWSISASRKFAIHLLTFDASDAGSHDEGLGSLLSFGGMVGSGPPAFRNRQLLALQRAGLVHFIGPSTRVKVEDGTFWACSPTVQGSTVRTRVLIDAWMRNHDLAHTEDDLLASLVHAGRARPYTRVGPDGRPRPSASPDIDPVTSRLVRTDGTLDVVHLVGIPVDDARGDGVISPMPRTNPTMLLDTAHATVSAVALMQAALR